MTSPLSKAVRKAALFSTAEPAPTTMCFTIKHIRDGEVIACESGPMHKATEPVDKGPVK